MGVSAIGARPESEIIATVRSAIARGANFFDLAGGHAVIFPAYGKALQGLREKVYLQVHFGADYTSGEYGWTTELKKIQAAVKWQLDNLQTDYIDFGFIHCLDEDKDLDAYQKNGVLDDVLELKRRGMIRHIGLSSHTPALVNRVLDMGIIDTVMFFINPVYDYGQGEFGIGGADDRQALYRVLLDRPVGPVGVRGYHRHRHARPAWPAARLREAARGHDRRVLPVLPQPQHHVPHRGRRAGRRRRDRLAIPVANRRDWLAIATIGPQLPGSLSGCRDRGLP